MTHAEGGHEDKKPSAKTGALWVVSFILLLLLIAWGLMLGQGGSRMLGELEMTPEQKIGLLKMQLSEVGKEPPPVACPTPREFDVATSTVGALTMVPEDCGRPRYVGVDAQGFTPWIRVDTRNGYRLATESVPLSAEWSKDLRPEDSHGYTWLRYGQVEGTTHFTSVKLTLRLVGTSAK